MEDNKRQMPSKEAWEIINMVDFCRVLRKKMIFPELNEISHTAIKDAISEFGISEEYLPRSLELGYIEQLDERSGEIYYKITGKDITQKEQAHTEYVRLCSGQ